MTTEGEPGRLPRRSIVDDLRAAAQRSDASRRLLGQRLESLNTLIQANGADEGPESRIRFSSLARFLYYVALDLHEQERRGSDKLQPRWRGLIDDYNEMCSLLGPHILNTLSNDDGLRGFCRFETRRTGNHAPLFYAGLAVYVIHLNEASRLGSNFLQMALPECEKLFPDQARKVFEEILEECRLTSPDEARPQSRASASRMQRPPEITIGFYYTPDKLERFEEFRAQYASPSDGGYAHFVGYRPSRADPARLMKTFVAIGPPMSTAADDDSRAESIRCVHVYHPPGPRSTERRRISRGGVVPLEEGVYLIGGQREANEVRPAHKTLKVVALPWWALERRDPVLPGLLMSANHDGKHILSRIALRPTPIVRSTNLRLGDVRVTNLVQDLVADAEIERAATAKAHTASQPPDNGWESAFPLCTGEVVSATAVRELEDAIRQLCNNSPSPEHGWDVEPGFQPIRTAKGDGALTKPRVDLKLETEFGSPSAPRYQRLDPAAPAGVEQFGFWSSLRFGPITHP